MVAFCFLAEEGAQGQVAQLGEGPWTSHASEHQPTARAQERGEHLG